MFAKIYLNPNQTEWILVSILIFHTGISIKAAFFLVTAPRSVIGKKCLISCLFQIYNLFCYRRPLCEIPITSRTGVLLFFIDVRSKR